MDISKAKRQKRLKVVTPEDAKPQENPPETPPTPFDSAPETPAYEPPRKKPGRPEKKGFWDNVNEIPAEAWQAKRFYIYAYLSEPFCNIKTEGEPGYLRKFYEPIDAEFILKEWGSGKYYLRLKEKKPGERTDRDVDALTFEILNPAYPPKLPRALWEKDPRNERWLAMLPKEQKETTQAETMQILNSMFDMQDRIEQRIKGDSEQQNPNTILDTATKLIELTRPKEQPATTPAVDPWAAAERILTMRSENPMVSILQNQLEALRSELAEERKERAAMQAQMFDAKLAAMKAELKPAQENTAPKSLIEQLKEFAGMKTELQNLLGIGGGDGAAAPLRGVNGTMQFWGDLVKEVVNSPMLSGVGPVILQMLTRPAGPGPQMPGAPGAQINPAQQNGNGQPHLSPEVELIQWAQSHLIDPLLSYLDAHEDGENFAASVLDMWPARLIPLQRMKHPQMPGQQGAPVIIEMFKHSDIWQSKLAYREAEFREFVQDFCAFVPDGAEAPPPAQQQAQQAAPAVDRSKEPAIDFDAEETPHPEVRP